MTKPFRRYECANLPQILYVINDPEAINTTTNHTIETPDKLKACLIRYLKGHDPGPLIPVSGNRTHARKILLSKYDEFLKTMPQSKNPQDRQRAEDLQKKMGLWEIQSDRASNRAWLFSVSGPITKFTITKSLIVDDVPDRDVSDEYLFLDYIPPAAIMGKIDMKALKAEEESGIVVEHEMMKYRAPLGVQSTYSGSG